MLVLARRLNESFMIGDQIEIVVVEIRGDQVKIGIKAPKSISIHRKEVYEDIQKENLAASKQNVPQDALNEFRRMLENQDDKQ